MLWATLIVGAIGVLLGLRLRVPALLAASAITAVLAIVHAVAIGESWLVGMVETFACLAALQAGYLGGLVLAHGWARSDPMAGDRPRGPRECADVLGALWTAFLGLWADRLGYGGYAWL